MRKSKQNGHTHFFIARKIYEVIIWESNIFLEREPVSKLLVRYSVPLIISLLVAALYNIIDQIFIANALYHGVCAFGQAMNPIISADGSPNYVMFSTLMGAGINIVLDPLFIFGFYWGMMGAALAAIMGQIFTALMSVRYIAFKMRAVEFSRANLSYNPKLMRRYLPLGLCSFISQVSLVISVAAVNMMIRKYGALDPVFGMPEYSQIPMAVIGIVMKFFQIVISVVVGLSASCTPITGYNIGAGRPDRVKKLFTLLLTCEAVIGLIAFVIVEVFPAQIAELFGASGESVHCLNFTVKSFRTYLCLIILACINKAAFIFIQATVK